VALHQNAYLSENCIRRGVPVVLVIWPKFDGLSTSVNAGLAKLGWLNRLKKSAVKRSD